MFDVIFICIAALFAILFICNAVKKVLSKNCPQTHLEVRIVEIRNGKRFVWCGTKFVLNWDAIITYELLSGNIRKRIIIPLKELDKVKKGDVGILTLQGTVYAGFERTE